MAFEPAPKDYDQFYQEQLKDALQDASEARTAGEVFYHAGTPKKALPCDGSTVSRVTYEALFGVIGTTFGAGDGSSTFGLPNISDLASGVSAWIRT